MFVVRTIEARLPVIYMFGFFVASAVQIVKHSRIQRSSYTSYDFNISRPKNPALGKSINNSVLLQ